MNVFMGGLKGICDFCIRKTSECQGKLDEKLLYLSTLKYVCRKGFYWFQNCEGNRTTEEDHNNLLEVVSDLQWMYLTFIVCSS